MLYVFLFGFFFHEMYIFDVLAFLHFEYHPVKQKH